MKYKMDPEIWGKLPWDLIERIASFADIDSRRALRFPPRKLPHSDFVPHPIAPTTFRYFPMLKKLIYLNFGESYEWEIYEEIEPDGAAWAHGVHGRHRGVWRGDEGYNMYDAPAGRPFKFWFAGIPEVIRD